MTCSLPWQAAVADFGESELSALDPGRAEIHLGWKPWTDVDTGLRRTVEYFRQHRNVRR